MNERIVINAPEVTAAWDAPWRRNQWSETPPWRPEWNSEGVRGIAGGRPTEIQASTNGSRAWGRAGGGSEWIGADGGRVDDDGPLDRPLLHNRKSGLEYIRAMLDHREPCSEPCQILPKPILPGSELGLACTHLRLQRPQVLPDPGLSGQNQNDESRECGRHCRQQAELLDLQRRAPPGLEGQPNLGWIRNLSRGALDSGSSGAAWADAGLDVRRRPSHPGNPAAYAQCPSIRMSPASRSRAVS